MAATADPRAKPPAPPSTHHLEPWARQQPPPASHASAARDRRRPSSSSRAGENGGIDELRAKLMGHLRDAADRLRVSHDPRSPPPPPTHAVTPPPEPEPTPPPLPPPPPPPSQQQADAVVADKPWKLRERTRRRPAALTSWPAAPAPRRRKRAPFSVALSPEEIEEDIYALTGGRPRRRPRKRPRGVQRQLDSLFPGLWLTEITADDYRVPDE